MSSTLKVDILQDSGGNNLVTSNGSGVITSAGFGKIGQVVQATTTTETIVSTTSYTDTTLSGSITPSSTSSKILISVHQGVDVSRNSDNNYAGIRLLRGSTVVFDPNPESTTGPATVGMYAAAVGAIRHRSIFNFSYIDSPNSSSELTYKTQGRPFLTANSGNVRFQIDSSENDQISVITLMEILP